MSDSRKSKSRGRGAGEERPARAAASLRARAIAKKNATERADPRMRLASRVNGLLSSAGMSQRHAAEHLGIPQPKISAIQNYRLHGISLERLIAALVALDQSVVITVTASKKRGRSVAVVVT